MTYAMCIDEFWLIKNIYDFILPIIPLKFPDHTVCSILVLRCSEKFQKTLNLAFEETICDFPIFAIFSKFSKPSDFTTNNSDL